MEKIHTLLAILVLSGCITFPTIRQEDLEAWRGVPLIELETHPGFSPLPLEKRPLSNGDELWTYKKMIQGSEASCKDRNGRIVCEGSSAEAGCLNQFIVGGGVVKEYRLIGVGIRCYTNCQNRPASRPCQ